MLDAAGAEPLGEVTRDIAGTVVRQELGSIGRLGLVSPLACSTKSSVAVTSSAFIVVHNFQATI